VTVNGLNAAILAVTALTSLFTMRLCRIVCLHPTHYKHGPGRFTTEVVARSTMQLRKHLNYGTLANTNRRRLPGHTI